MGYLKWMNDVSHNYLKAIELNVQKNELNDFLVGMYPIVLL